MTVLISDMDAHAKNCRISQYTVGLQKEVRLMIILYIRFHFVSLKILFKSLHISLSNEDFSILMQNTI